MNDMIRIQRDFSSAAQEYDFHAVLQQRVLCETLELARNVLQPGSHVLDAGCGTGMFATFAPPDWKITQLDIAFGMCKKASGNARSTVMADIAELPFALESFAGIFSSLTLQWAVDLPKIFASLHEILKPGGNLVFSTLGPETLKELKALAPYSVHEFLSSEAVLIALQNTGFLIKAFHALPVVMHYANLHQLLQNLKRIGATYKGNRKTNGLATPRQFHALENSYRNTFMEEKGVRATWDVHYWIAEKI